MASRTAKKDQVFTAEEKAAMKEAVREAKAAKEGADQEVLEHQTLGLDELTAAVEPFTLDQAAEVSGLAEAELGELLASVRAAGPVPIHTGTGATIGSGDAERCSRSSATYVRSPSSAPGNDPPVPTPSTNRPPERSWTVAAAIAASVDVLARIGITPVPSPSVSVSPAIPTRVASVSRDPVSGRKTVS